MTILKSWAEAHLDKAGVQLNGPNPWDIQVRDERLYRRALLQGSLGLGEAYMDGWWDAEAPDQFLARLLGSGVDRVAQPRLKKWSLNLTHSLFNFQTPMRARKAIQSHYDIGTDVYQCMLDPLLVYTCGYWKEAKTLEEAQIAKLDLVCRKVHLKPGMRVLDIGCGFGGFAKYAAEHYGVEVVGVTLSVDQHRIGNEVCAGLPVDIRLQDYRHITDGPFDAIVSLGMFEHVGYKNYRTYMEVVRRCLKDDGLFLLHTIGGNCSVNRTEPWMHRYIFPNGMVPSIEQIDRSIQNLFTVVNLQNFGPYYDQTLMAWNENFQQAWPFLSNAYDERFKRTWEYYLLGCAAYFRVRRGQLWQIVLSRHGVPDGYVPVY